MKSQKINFYFILYLIAVISIFAATVEKEHAIDKVTATADSLRIAFEQIDAITSEQEGAYYRNPTIDVNLELDQSYDGGTLHFNYSVARIDPPLVGDHMSGFELRFLKGNHPAHWNNRSIQSDPHDPWRGTVSLPLSTGATVNDEIEFVVKLRRDVRNDTTYFREQSKRDSIQRRIDNLMRLNGGFITGRKVVHIKYNKLTITQGTPCKLHDIPDCPECKKTAAARGTRH